ncbi:hypothetical protein Tco_0087058 [Tanacetum coccineum]
MDWLSKRKFVIVCHEKVVRIPLDGDEILRVHSERTQGVVKTLLNTKTRVSYELVIFREEHQCRLLGRGAWSSFEVSVRFSEEGEVVTYLLVDALTRKERVKPRRVRAMAMTIQYGVRGMKLAAQSEAFKQKNVPLVGSEMDEAHASSLVALDLGFKVLWSKNEGTDEVLEGTAKVHESTDKVLEGTASFIREGKIIMARIWRFIEEVIMKKIEYCLFDVVVEFHREMITSQLQGKLRLYDEVRARTLFVLSSSNRGRLLGIIDLMRQKNKRMKQEGLNRQIGKLQDVLNAHIRYHLKELRYCAQCLIIENEDFVKRSRDHYMEPTEFEIQEMIKLLRIPKIDAIKSGTTDIEFTSREALENHNRAYYDGPWLSLGGLCKYIQVAKKTTDAVSKEIGILQATSIRGLDA